MNRGEIKAGDPHPAAYTAKEWISTLPKNELFRWSEAFASCAIEGNPLAEVCAETLRRLLSGEPVSDRYLLGLAWTMRSDQWPEPKKKNRAKRGQQKGQI